MVAGLLKSLTKEKKKPRKAKQIPLLSMEELQLLKPWDVRESYIPSCHLFRLFLSTSSTKHDLLLLHLHKVLNFGITKKEKKSYYGGITTQVHLRPISI